jgi:hypothetical protein
VNGKLPTGISKDHPCEISTLPEHLYSGLYNPVTGVVDFRIFIHFSLCSSAQRGLPKGDPASRSTRMLYDSVSARMGT